MTMLAQFAAAGGGALPAYIEDVFSTYLYTGNGATQTITNGIDLAGKGGLTWFKSRASVSNHFLFDSARGTNKYLRSQLVNAEGTSTSDWISSFNSNGFSLGSNAFLNTSDESMVSWTFRKQPKFFDVVTYTGTGAAQNIAHNLGSVPGCIIAKNITSNGNWHVYHRSLGDGNVAYLNLTSPPDPADYWNNTTPTSTVFSVKSENSLSGQTYVAYLFAHDAGGFGLSGEDNVVSCGLATVASANAVVTLGWEPQYVLYKQSDGFGAWSIIDSMRGLTANQVANNSRVLYANGSNAEETNNGPALTSTGFVLPYAGGAAHANGNYIYIAIRRGPMKVPTDGTTVFTPVTTTSASNPLTVTAGFPVDLSIQRLASESNAPVVTDRLRGASTTSSPYLVTSSTAAETATSGFGIGMANNLAIIDNGFLAGGSAKKIYWQFRRAPGFFDEVCYTGSDTAGNLTLYHNLAKKPELIIAKARNDVQQWKIEINMGSTTYQYFDSLTAAIPSGATAYGTGHLASEPTSSTFAIKTDTGIGYGFNYVAYLFATCPGVSKVGSYTGTGATQTINCGFTGGARFVLIKRTDSTGDWYVWDSARGIVAGNDPYLLLNSTAVEVTSTDYVDTAATGFELTSTAPAAINASGGSFIFLAIS